MTDNNIRINDNLVVEYEDISYKSTVQDITEDYLVINLPLGEGEYLTLEDGEPLDMGYMKNGGYYMLKSEILGRLIEDGKPYYKIKIPVETKRIERRDFVRISLLDYTFYQFNGTWKKAMVIDLSGGGMRLIIKEKVRLGDKILVGLALGNESFKIYGQIVRIVVNEMRENVCGIQFLDIDERTQDRIIAKIFVQLRKKLEMV